MRLYLLDSGIVVDILNGKRGRLEVTRVTSGLRLQAFTKEPSQAGSIQFMVRHLDHGFVGGQFGQAAGVNAVDFKKIQSRLYTCTFVAVEVCLAFRNMPGVRTGD